jgi:hypothetical protein
MPRDDAGADGDRVLAGPCESLESRRTAHLRCSVTHWSGAGCGAPRQGGCRAASLGAGPVAQQLPPYLGPPLESGAIGACSGARPVSTKGRADGKTFSVGIVAWWTAAIPLSAGLGVAVLPPGKATFTRKHYAGPAAVRVAKVVIEKFEWVAVAASATLRLRATSSDQCACH